MYKILISERFDIIFLANKKSQSAFLCKTTYTSKSHHHGEVDKPLALYPGIPSSIPGYPSLPNETLSHGPIS